MNLPEDFIFSQSALQDYVDCARRFELRYVNEVEWPALETQATIEHEEMMQQGQLFHHLLHQHALGVPPQVIEATIRDDQLRLWWDGYMRWQAEHLPAERHPELMLTAEFHGKRVMAKYDLIARKEDGSFLIVDWKTGKPPKQTAFLAARMQTLVYPLVLARAGDWLNDGAPISPERITMIYWFAEGGRSVEIPLSAEKFAADEKKLSQLLDGIEAQSEFALTAIERHCRFCVYRSLCDRGEAAGRPDELNEEEELTEAISLDLDAIEEIAF